MKEASLNKSDNAISVTSLSKSFGQTKALKDVSLTVPTGSIFGFLGPNGSGKTTTLRGLMGLIKFDTGTASMLRLDPWHDRVALHAKLGYLPSGMGMNNHIRGIDLLDQMAALTPAPGNISPLRAQLLAALELSQRDLNRAVGTYSKGMKQKLAIVCAMQHDPELLLMDEPSEGLDPLIQHEFYQILRERAKNGRTILFSSHTLSEVEELCQYVAFIRTGTLIMQSKLEDLRQRQVRTVKLSVKDNKDLEDLSPKFIHTGSDYAGNAIFKVTASANQIIRELSDLDLTNLLIEEPTLDDIFRQYYTGDQQ